MNKIYFNFKSLVLVSFLFVIWSCDDSEDIVPNEYLLQSEERGTRFIAGIETLFQAAGAGNVEQYLEHDVKLFYMEYSTTYKGESITASALVGFPETDEALPMLSFQHGTSTAHREAPTEDDTYEILAGVASAGYIFIAPDMLGFGSSRDILHPYYHKELTAEPIKDMISATMELAREQGYNINGDLFLAGYSEGGYATMVTHQSIENDPIQGVELIASAPSSGGYDIKGMQEYFFSLESYHQPYYMAFVALSYKSVYDWELPLSAMFQEPYASNLEGYFDGSLTGGQINDNLTFILEDYLTPEFYNDIDTDNQFQVVLDAFSDNTVHNWVPQKRMYMYHGTADITVPYQNSVDTYEHMLTLGASESVVTFHPIPDATHATGVIPYIESFIAEFEQLK